MRIGIVVGDLSSLHAAKTDLQSYLLREKFVFNIVKHFTQNLNVDMHVIRKQHPSKIVDIANSEKLDFVLAVQCENRDRKINGVGIRYNMDSERAKDIANIFKKNILAKTNFPDVSIIPTCSSDRDGSFMRQMKPPCIVAEPFPSDISDSEVQTFMLQYRNIINAYVSAVDEVSRLIS